MTLRFDDSWVVATVLLWVRVSALFLSSPLFTSSKVPIPFVVLLTLALAGTLTIAHNTRAPDDVLQSALRLSLAALTEAVIGMTLGFAIQCALAAFGMAGQLLDIQMGTGLGSIFNPVSRTSSPAVAMALSLFSTAYFFAVDAHLAVVRGIAFSVSSIPLGSSWFLRSPELLIRPVAAMFSLAIVVIAPVLFILLLVELAVMVAARVLPQMNVFFVATPAKTAVGLGALALSGSFMAPVAARAYADIFRFWTEVSR